MSEKTVCPVVVTENSLRIQVAAGESHTIELSRYSADILRLRAWRGAEAPRERSMVVSAKPVAVADWRVENTPGGLAIEAAGLGALIGKDGTVAFRRGGRTLVSAGARRFPSNNLPNPEDRCSAEQTFALDAGDAIYGLGQYQNGVMNWRNHDVILIHGNVTVAVPFLVSTGGWGMLWDNPSHTEFHDGPDGMRLWSEVADAVDCYICAGDSMDAVIACYRRLTGAAPLFPRAYYGYIQCKERYKTAAELADVVREHRRRKLPLDVIVQDWQYWGPGMDNWSGMRHDPVTYGDLPAAIREIHDMHASVMISIWPRIGQNTPLGKALGSKGYLFEGRPDQVDKVYDAFSKEARDIYWQYAKEGLFDLGVDSWWMDGTEPEIVDCHVPERHKAALLSQHDTSAGSWARVLNAYSLETTRGVYENQRKTSDRKRVFILTRSAFAGQQAFAAAVWSGDIGSNWKTFADQIPAGLNFCIAGIPYWTTDNGGFFSCGRGGTFPEGVKDPAFRELFLRWLQYSCFCPLMRSHGTQTPREIWHFGEPGDPIYDGLAGFVHLRMRLLPYTYSLAAMTTFDNYTPMRALAMDFPRDQRVLGIADQFLYGPALMACPVIEPMVHMPGEHLAPFGTDDLETDKGKGRWMQVFNGIAAKEASDEKLNRSFFDHNWSGNFPAGATSASYRVEFSGRVQAGRTKSSAIVVRVAGRVRVDLAGKRVVDDWVDGPLREHRIPIVPELHRNAELRVTYGHETGDAVIQVGWEINRQWTERGPVARLERAVYLPAGATWYDFWTGARLEGGQTVKAPAPFSHIPVFARAGSILPLGPDKQWQDEIPDDPLELRIYPGADGRFTLYEDAGDSYDYEKGARSAIEFAWDNGARRLSIGRRTGGFKGMLERRKFRVVVVGSNHGVGIDPTAAADREIAYDGAAVVVDLR